MVSFNKEEKQKFNEQLIKMAEANNWENQKIDEVTLLKFMQK